MRDKAEADGNDEASIAATARAISKPDKRGVAARVNACGLNPCCGLAWYSYNAPRKRREKKMQSSHVPIGNLFTSCMILNNHPLKQ